MPYQDINSHRSMVTDTARNIHYFRALQQVVSPSSVVLDIGAGVGIHGLMAAQLGASHVYLVEPESVIAVAEEASRKNGVAHKVTCIQARIESVELPEEVDVITSVFTGNFMLSEDLLPSLFFARDRFLRSGGCLLPDAGRMYVMPIHAPGIFESRIAAWSEAQFNVDLSVARVNAANSVHYFREKIGEYRPLSAPYTINTLDFERAVEASCSCTGNIEVEEGGLCHGLLGWFDMKLDEWVSTGPLSPETHWSLTYLPIDPPLNLHQGEQLSVKINRPEFGDWTWSISAQDGTRSHSEFFGKALAINDLRKASDSYVPDLSTDALITRFVLDRIDGQVTTDELCRMASEHFGKTLGTQNRLQKTVKRIVSKYG